MSSKPKNRQSSRPLQAPDGEAVPFGIWLRRQREAREISLREIADASKISLRYLEAFEQDRFELLPARVFVQGFLREYARYVGLDPDEVVNHYLASQNALEPEELPKAESAQDFRPRSSWLWQVLLVLGVVATLAIAAVLAFESERKRSADQPAEDKTVGSEAGRRSPAPAQATLPGEGELQESDDAAEVAAAAQPPRLGEPLVPASEEPTEGDSGVPPQAPGEAPAAVLARTSPLRVEVSFTQSCWVEMTVDGRRSQREHAAGEQLTLEAQRAVVLTLGNAGGVQIQVNGHAFPVNKGLGQVARDIRIDLETLQELTPGP